MKIWRSIKRNYSKLELKVFLPILEWLGNIARPMCPICKHGMLCWSRINGATCYKCLEDKILYFYPGPFKGYYEFLGKTFSRKQFRRLVRLKVFW